MSSAPTALTTKSSIRCTRPPISHYGSITNCAIGNTPTAACALTSRSPTSLLWNSSPVGNFIGERQSVTNLLDEYTCFPKARGLCILHVYTSCRGLRRRTCQNPALLPEQESEDQNMATAKVFRSGNSQAVRLPKQFRLKSKEVEISRRGDEIVLRERRGTMARAFDLLAALPEDLKLPGREKDKPQKRKGL